MSRFPMVEEDQATEEVRDIYKSIRRDLGFGFVPNLFKSMAISPTVLRGNWEKVKFTILSGTVPRTLKEMICVVVSTANNSKYCVKTHLHSLRSLGVDDKVCQGLTGNIEDLQLPTRTKIILKFALKVALRPDEVKDNDIEELMGEGLTEEEILEILSTANLITLLNDYVQSVNVDLDECYVQKR
ncbi:MAG: peroxidase-related enzyme [Thermodesulfobacteriota bacterium]